MGDKAPVQQKHGRAAQGRVSQHAHTGNEFFGQKADAARAVYIQIAAEAARDGQLGGVRPAKPFHAQQRAKPGADGAFGKLYHADVFLRRCV